MIPSARGTRSSWWQAGLVLAAALLCFSGTIGHEFVNWDDDVYVLNNPAVGPLSAGAVARMFTTYVSGNYHPLTILSYAVDYQWTGKAPLAYHATNLVLHGAASVLAFWVLRLLGVGGAGALFGGLLFAVHPVHAEAVSWVTGRKDLLAAAFFLGAIVAYLRFLERRRPLPYAAAVALSVLAVLSKSTAATLPAALLLVDWLRRRSDVRAVILEKIPFLVVAAAGAWAAVLARADYQSMLREGDKPLLHAAVLQLHRLYSYFLPRTVALVNDGALYPDFMFEAALDRSATISVVLATAVAIGIVAVSLARGRKVAFGAAFFLLTLAPVLTVTILGSLADRFLYLPLLGVCYLAGEGLDAILARVRAPAGRAAVGVAAAAVVAAYGVLSWQQAAIWKDSFSLWSYCLERDPRNVNAWHKRGKAALAAGNLDAAIADLTSALEITGEYSEAWTDRATAFRLKGEVWAAIADYSRALAINDRSVSNHWERAGLYARVGYFRNAVADLDTVIARRPSVDAYLARATAYFALKEDARAISDVEKAKDLGGAIPPALLWEIRNARERAGVR